MSEDKTVVSVDYSPGGTTFMVVVRYEDGVVTVLHHKMTFVDFWPQVEEMAQKLARTYGATEIIRESVAAPAWARKL